MRRKASSFTSTNTVFPWVFGDYRTLGIVNCPAWRPWCKAAHWRFPYGRRSVGTRLMSLWFVFALMTAAAIFAVLWPLGRGGPPQDDASEAAVYKDQLTEIDRDVAAGLIGRPEAEAARVEISRRLLAAADNQRDPPVASNIGLRRSAAVIALVGLPIVAVALYLPLCSPPPPEFPFAPSICAPHPAPPPVKLRALRPRQP